jgi:hypothetical protein
MNVNHGGKQTIVRNSVITAECKLGESAKLKVGDTQRMYFEEGDDPPFYNPGAPAKDTLRVINNKRTGNPKLIHIEGYVGKAKGIKQILFERGLYNDEMVSHATYCRRRTECAAKGLPIPNQEDIDMEFVLNSQYDFKMEKSTIQKLIESRGHIFLPSVKCHPEMAGSGIEYVWGASERKFRKMNGQSTDKFLENVSYSLSCESIPLSTIWKFERKCRDYMRSYKITGTQLTYDEVEDARKLCKSHRNISETHRAYIRNVMETDAAPNINNILL